MDGNDRADMRHERVIKQERVRGHLDHDGIAGLQMLGDPGFKLIIGNFVGTKHCLFLGIDTHGHKIRFVDVQPDPS